MTKANIVPATKGVSQRTRQTGSSLLEPLVAIVIFSVGIIGMAGLQARAVSVDSDAKYRADAADLTSQIIGQMWADRNNLSGYAHYATAGAAVCINGGTASANANVTNWMASLQSALPGAGADQQQIAIGPNNVVTVTVCWKSPGDAASHNYVATAQING